MPFGVELRKVLFRFGECKELEGIGSDLMFPSREGGRREQRNALRSYYCMLRRLGLPRSGFHRLRHSFATQQSACACNDSVRRRLMLSNVVSAA